MLAPLAEALPQLLRVPTDRVVRTVREPSIGLVIPDLLVAYWAPDAPPIAGPTTLVDACVRALLEERGCLREQDIAELLCLDAAATSASVRRLRRQGAIELMIDAQLFAANAPVNRHPAPRALAGVRDTVRNDAVDLTAGWIVRERARLGTASLIAVEAKLTRWQDAVAQAARYLAFADRAVTVLDGNQVAPHAALIETVRAAGVGLVLQYRHVLREIVPAPQHAPPITADRAIAVSKVVPRPGVRAFRVRPSAWRESGALV